MFTINVLPPAGAEGYKSHADFILKIDIVRVSLGLRSQARISSRLLNHSNATPMPSVPSLNTSYCQTLVHPGTLNIPEAMYIVYGPLRTISTVFNTMR